MKTPIHILAGAVCVLAVTAQAASAAHTLTLDAPPDVAVGQLTTVTAHGTMPPDEIGFPYWFSLDAIPASFTTTCPDDHFVGGQFAGASGGAVLTSLQPEHPDSSGNWTVPVAVNATSPGTVLLCGYTDDGSDGTLAVASKLVNIHAGASQPQAKTAIPSQVRAAVRSCRALLSGHALKTCIRHAVATGKSQCRKLPRSRRAACIRGVQSAKRAR